MAVFLVVLVPPHAWRHPAAASVPEMLRILNINVWSGLDYRGYLMMGEYESAAVREKRYQALLAQIRRLAPDIIGIHEANKLPDYADALRQIREGAALRAGEAKKTIRFIREIAGAHPFVLVGDLNAEPDGPEIRQLKGAGLTDLFERIHPGWAGYTWDPRSNRNHALYYSETASRVDSTDLVDMLAHWYRRQPRRIDYIFAGPGSLLKSDAILPQACRVELNRVIGGVHVSDHYGVLAEILLQPQKLPSASVRRKE